MENKKKVEVKILKSFDWKRLTSLIIFGLAFAFDEATVVVYLRTLFGYTGDYSTLAFHPTLPLGFLSVASSATSIFNNPQIIGVESHREAATIIMLAALAWLSGKTWRSRLGAFLIAFSIWDLFYYVFLHFLTGWPKSLFDIDVFIIVPTLIGPIITAVVLSLSLLFAGVLLIREVKTS